MIRPLIAIAALAAAVPAVAAPPVNSYNQRLLSLDKARQAAAVRSGITGNGQRCGRIEQPVYRGPYKNTFMWAARCHPGGEYALFLGPDGSAQVRDCAQMAQLKLPLCNLPPATKTLPRRAS